MSNHVAYHPRTKFFQKLEDLIEIGKYNDFGSPYVVLLPQGSINLCIQSSIFSVTNQHIKAKDFYTYYAYVSSKSISRIMAQLMTGVRNSISFKRGVLSMAHEFKFVISEIQFSKYIVDVFVDGYKVRLHSIVSITYDFSKSTTLRRRHSQTSFLLRQNYVKVVLNKRTTHCSR